VALVGDSLNLGLEPYLKHDLDGWSMSTDDVVGRQTEEGIGVLAAAGTRLSPIVVISLGTNDAPDDAEAFARRVGEVVRLAGPGRCIVWATIWRDGAPLEAFNRILRARAQANRRFRVVEWAAMVQRHPDWLAPDGLHGSETGYLKRASAVAAAARDCVPAGEPA
jgi:lysophospholipase L1-like esterase